MTSASQLVPESTGQSLQIANQPSLGNERRLFSLAAKLPYLGHAGLPLQPGPGPGGDELVI